MKYLIAILVVVGLGFCVWSYKKEPAPTPIPLQIQPTIPTTPTPDPIKAVRTYEGTWVTGGARKRNLNGTMTSVVTNTGTNQWSGRFFGVWEGVKFSYTVAFSGSQENLTGTATIDGANYTWTGKVVADNFSGVFTSSRYDGNFNLKEKS